jgi:mono/diheme cytochrome c family protein
VQAAAGGMYSVAQAKRGESIYQDNCISCHGSELGGTEGGPALIGEDFNARWKGKPISELLDLLKTTMPQTAPGSLANQQYADVVAFLLSKNRFPAGQTDLPSESGKLSEFIYVVN